MHEVDDYIRSLAPDEQKELERIKAVVLSIVPDAAQGVSYGMPAFMYQGKPVLSVMVRKSFISLYPFSGKVIDRLSQPVTGSTGSIHFTLEAPLSEALLQEIITLRLQEIAS